MGRGVSKKAIVIDVSYRPGAARKQDVLTREIDEPFHESTTYPLEAYLCYLVKTRPLVDRLTISKPATGASVSLARDDLRGACASADYAALAVQLETLKGSSAAGTVKKTPPKPEDQEIDEEELGQAGEDEPIEDEEEEEPVNPEFEDDGWYYSDED